MALGAAFGSRGVPVGGPERAAEVRLADEAPAIGDAGDRHVVQPRVAQVAAGSMQPPAPDTSDTKGDEGKA